MGVVGESADESGSVWVRSSGLDVVDESGDRGSDRKVRTGSNRLEIGVESSGLIGDQVELDIDRVRTRRRGDLLTQRGQIDLGCSAVGVVDDGDAVDLELIHRLDQRAQHVGCDPGPGVAHDVDVTGGEAEHREWVDPAVHARDDGEVSTGDG